MPGSLSKLRAIRQWDGIFSRRKPTRSSIELRAVAITIRRDFRATGSRNIYKIYVARLHIYDVVLFFFLTPASVNINDCFFV